MLAKPVHSYPHAEQHTPLQSKPYTTLYRPILLQTTIIFHIHIQKNKIACIVKPRKS